MEESMSKAWERLQESTKPLHIQEKVEGNKDAAAGRGQVKMPILG